MKKSNYIIAALLTALLLVVGLGMNEPAKDNANKQKVERWEYTKFNTQQDNDRTRLAKMNKLGAEGWEFVGCFSEYTVSPQNHWVMYFKRRLP